MDKRTARDVILAYTCCSFSNNDNNLCNVCPWSNSGKCNDMVLDEKNNSRSGSCGKGDENNENYEIIRY